MPTSSSVIGAQTTWIAKLPPWLTVRFRVEFLDEQGQLPPYAGSMLRGALLRALRAELCSAPRGQTCDACGLRRHCAYAQRWDPPPSATRRFPAGFLILPPPPAPVDRPVRRWSFGIRLIGKAVDDLPVLLRALPRMLDRGLGKGHARARLLAIDPQPITAEPSLTWWREEALGERVTAVLGAGSLVSVELLTPTRHKHRGSFNGPLTPLAFTMAALRRLRALGAHWPRAEWEALHAWARATEVRGDRTWIYRWRRYSQRQGRYIAMDGRLGRIAYALPIPGAAELLAVWIAASSYHIGKGTTMGLGAYRITNVEE